MHSATRLHLRCSGCHFGNVNLCTDATSRHNIMTALYSQWAVVSIALGHLVVNTLEWSFNRPATLCFQRYSCMHQEELIWHLANVTDQLKVSDLSCQSNLDSIIEILLIWQHAHLDSNISLLMDDVHVDHAHFNIWTLGLSIAHSPLNLSYWSPVICQHINLAWKSLVLRMKKFVRP